MAQKGIREFQAKQLFDKHWEKYFGEFHYPFHSLLVHDSKDLEQQALKHDWLNSKGLVIKPDMLFGKRGHNQLVLLKDKEPGDVSLDIAKTWIDNKIDGETILTCGSKGKLNTFIVEPFYRHTSEQEYYLALSVDNDCDILYMSAHGGVNIEDEWDTVTELKLPLDMNQEEIKEAIDLSIPNDIVNKDSFLNFALGFYNFFKDLHFSYLELNPFIIEGKDIHLLDVVARLDDTARFLMTQAWDRLEYPAPFGCREKCVEEMRIDDMDEKSGASLKLTILNPKGLVWTLVAGGGASVVFADSIADLWGAKELANYGEYSGNPSKDETYFYAKNVLDLMVREPDPAGRGKILIIGGSIANFTDVAKTFEGIIQAFEELHEQMRAVGVKIYVRRGGPKYEIALKNIQTKAQALSLPIQVYGPETHLTDIVRMALTEQIDQETL